jgi:pimeloyl-ACP methyl ester carboxylesterase
MEAVTHHGRTTAYRVAAREGADGAPVLCVHGSGGTSGLWAGQRPLSAERPVVAVDLSGHGGSEDVAADPGYETMSAHVDDVLAVARATDARVLVGNSLGGAVALTLALERAHAFEGLVLTGTGAKLSVLDDLLAWLDEDFERAVEFLHGPDRLFHDADERVLERSMAAMRETGPRVTRRDFRSCHTFDVRDRLDAVDVPAVAVVGEHDRLTPRRYHEYLARELPTCELAVVEDAAHLAMLESPTAFNAVLSEFCARFVD